MNRTARVFCLRNVAFASLAVNLFFLGYFSAHLPFMGPHAPGHGHRPPFLFRDSISPEHLHVHFAAMRAIRAELIQSLRADTPPTKAQLDRYLDRMEKEMQHLQDEAQDVTVQRILAMSPQERLAFARTLEEEDAAPHHSHE